MCSEQVEYELSEEVEMLWNMRLQEQRNQVVEKEVSGTFKEPDSEELRFQMNQEEETTVIPQVGLVSKEEQAMEENLSKQLDETINNARIENETAFQSLAQDALAETDLKQEVGEKVCLKEREDGSVLQEVKASLHDVRSTEDYTYTVASATGDFLQSGKTAEEILGYAISRVCENLEERDPYAISILGERISTVRGLRLQAYITAVILNTSEITRKFIVLVLESFTQEQIYELYENDFILKTLQDQPQLAHVIFLSPSHQNVKNFSGISLNKQKNESDQFSSNESIDFRDMNYADYANSETIRRTDVPTPDTFVMMDEVHSQSAPLINSQPVSTFFDNKMGTRSPFQEHRYNVSSRNSSYYDISMRSMENGRFMEPEPDKTDDGRGQQCFCVGCFFGIFNFIGDMIAQFGDCCCLG